MKIWILCCGGKNNILATLLEHKIHIFSPLCNILYEMNKNKNAYLRKLHSL